jgi:hypothetical protein
VNEKPCKKCGHCPHCGRGGHTTAPWPQRHPYRLIWAAPYPNYPYGTYGGTTYGGNVSIQASSSRTYC